MSNSNIANILPPQINTDSNKSVTITPAQQSLFIQSVHSSESASNNKKGLPASGVETKEQKDFSCKYDPLKSPKFFYEIESSSPDTEGYPYSVYDPLSAPSIFHGSFSTNARECSSPDTEELPPSTAEIKEQKDHGIP